MKILIATLGTYGDIYPATLIAKELVHRGHSVTFSTSENFRELVESSGCLFQNLRPNFSQNHAERWFDPYQGDIAAWKEILLPNLLNTYLDLEPAAAKADVFITNGNIASAIMIASRFQLTWFTIILSPYSMGLPHEDSNELPAHMSYVYQLIKNLPPMVMNAVINLQRVLISNLPSNRTFKPIIKKNIRLGLFSKYLTGIPNYWGKNVFLTGFVQEPSVEKLSDGLINFLNQGTPPVVLTMGTAVVKLIKMDFYDMFIEAAKLHGLRIVILANDFEGALQEKYSANENIYIRHAAPNSALFPFACFIVHHGGTGTLAETVRSKKPSLIVPFAYDQPHNAYLAEKLGIARYILREDLNIDRISKEFGLIRDNKKLEEVGKFASYSRKENGVETACNLIETMACQETVPPC